MRQRTAENIINVLIRIKAGHNKRSRCFTRLLSAVSVDYSGYSDAKFLIVHQHRQVKIYRANGFTANVWNILIVGDFNAARHSKSERRRQR